MARFRFGVTVPSLPGAYDTAALGVDGLLASRFGPNDINKAVKLAANNNYVLAADGNDLEGVCFSVEPATVNDGFSHGTVQKRFTELEVLVSGAALAVGAAVVCAAQNALGTIQAAPAVKAGAGALFKWRVKSLLAGTGQIGELVLIEPITR
jgi:hypothetical protein